MKIGILGGGQLAQMMAQAGASLGMEFIFLCPNPQACAAPFGQHICAEFDDREALQQLIDASDVVTYEFENVPSEPLEALEKQVVLHPSAMALSLAKDRLHEKNRFAALGIPTAEFADIANLADLEEGARKIGFPALLKTRTQGYDGKGQILLRGPDDLATAWNKFGKVPCILESMVDFSREVSIIAVRSRSGEIAFYPLSENSHRDGILRLSLSRSQDSMQEPAEALIQRLLEDMNYVGVLALELFQVGSDLYANEMAPRVHNTGHWTIEGTRSSQFENHLRAVSGMPLGDTSLKETSAMVNLIGSLPAAEAIRAIPDAASHFYGKENRPGRKVGHITLTCEDCTGEIFNQRLAKLLELAGESELASQTHFDVEVSRQKAAEK